MSQTAASGYRYILWSVFSLNLDPGRIKGARNAVQTGIMKVYELAGELYQKI